LILWARLNMMVKRKISARFEISVIHSTEVRIKGLFNYWTRSSWALCSSGMWPHVTLWYVAQDFRTGTWHQIWEEWRPQKRGRLTRWQENATFQSTTHSEMYKRIQ
jgi:hypothetical protein